MTTGAKYLRHKNSWMNYEYNMSEDLKMSLYLTNMYLL